MSLDPDRLHRTVKLELDDGRAASIEDAHRIAATYVLQVDVGDDIRDATVLQAMLVTAANTAARAFAGGVHVRCGTNPELTIGWAAGRTLSSIVEQYGGTMTTELSDDRPTLVVGDARAPVGEPVLYLTHDRWTGGAVPDPADRLPGDGHVTLAGVLAAALGVSEMFQYVRRSIRTGYRPVGLSLWNPGADWRDRGSAGPPCPFLPKRLAIMGLGHLGQAVCWALGFLPYADARAVDLLLQDFDAVVEANVSTGLLTCVADVGKRKTRVVASRMETLGIRTAIIESPVGVHTRRADRDPSWAIAGFDRAEPRRHLADAAAGYHKVVDIGLGAGPEAYLDILIHSFPGGTTSAEAWPSRTPTNLPRPLGAAYELIRDAEVRSGVADAEARCGVVQLADRSAAASFVGAVAACLAIADVMRALHGGRGEEVPTTEIVSVSLASPDRIDVVTNEVGAGHLNPGYVPCAR
jgi:hypothetical protein